MVYGVLRLINFAHGDVAMVGGVVGWYIAAFLLRHGWGCGHRFPGVRRGRRGLLRTGVGHRIFRVSGRCRNQPRLVSLITAIGVSLLLENVCQLSWIFGPTPQIFPEPIKHALGSGVQLLTLGLSLLLMIVLTWVVLRTKTGLALRGVSYRFDTATLMGINTNRIISFTFILGSGLAAVAGVLNSIQYNVEPLMGVLPGLKAFIAAVLGGIGSIPGVVLGGFCIGLLETFLRGSWLPEGYTGYADGGCLCC